MASDGAGGFLILCGGLVSLFPSLGGLGLYSKAWFPNVRHLVHWSGCPDTITLCMNGASGMVLVN